MNVLITGGAGYIGSHATRSLLKAGHRVTIIDNLSHGDPSAIQGAAAGLENQPQFFQCDVLDESRVAQTLEENRIDAVLHFAGFIEVGESIQVPEKYYQNNFFGTLSLLKAMKRTNVRRLVFSSTAAIYGDPTAIPLTENHPLVPINPYGRSKLAAEWAIQDFSKTFELGYSILRYFNVAGASLEGVIGEAHQPESHLIPRVLLAASGELDAIGIFGTDYATPDGTCIRDYVHVEDLVEAHLLALERIRPSESTFYNLGSERGFSVREVINTCAQITGKEIRAVEKPRRSGDPAVLIASSAKIRKELTWERRFPDLTTIVSHAWNWHKKRAVNPHSAGKKSTEGLSVSI